jgi:hypothetical protein
VISSAARLPISPFMANFRVADVTGVDDDKPVYQDLEVVPGSTLLLDDFI